LPDAAEGIVNTTSEARRSSRTIWLVLALATALRAALPLIAVAVTRDASVFHTPDSASYVALAQGLASGRFQTGGEPEIVRTPGYPLLLVPGVLLGRVELVAIAIQVLLNVLTAYLLYRIAWLLFENAAVAWGAALLYALDPLSIAYTSRILTETPFTFLVVAFLYALTQHLKSDGVGPLVVAGAALAASVFVRPAAYFLPVLAAAWLILRAVTRRPNRLRRLLCAGLFLIVAMAPAAAWQLRNARQTGWGGFSAIGPVTLYFYHGAAVRAAVEGRPYYEMQSAMGYHNEDVYLSRHPEQRSWTRARRIAALRSEGIRVLLEHPLTAAAIHVKGAARALLDPAAFDYAKMLGAYPRSGGMLGVAVDRGLLGALRVLRRKRPLVFWANVVLGLVLGGYLLLALVGLFSRTVLKTPGAAALLLVGGYFLILSGGPQAECRFRHPIVPVLCVLASCGVGVLAGKLRRKQAPGGAGSVKSSSC